MRKLLAAETLNNLTILSQKRKEQDYAQLYQTFTIECNGECFDVVAIHEKEAAKLFGLYLWHKGDLHWLEEGSKPVLVKVRNTMVSSIFNLWRSKQKIYAEVTFYKNFHTYVLPTPAPHAQPIHASIMQEIPNALTKEDEPLYVLKTIFGYESFREGQLEAIQAIVGGKDCVILMPTGGGKSLIFAVAAIVKQGLTVVIEPLKFLMEEQVAILREKGVSAFYFNSSLTDTEMDFVIHSLTRFRSQYVMLFTSPECIFSERLKKVLSSWNAIGKLGLIAVDEAHCIDSWGVGFRPDYTRLGELKSYGTVIAAFTGTATPHSLQVLIDTLKLQECSVIQTSFLRDNLFIEVLDKKDNAKQQLATMILEKFQNNCGIVYCARRQDAVDVAHELKKYGVSVTYVHGALSDIDRKKNEELWSNDNAKVMCATKCFGMGINKGNVRFVIHLTFPESLEDYYQEIGRAGRDGYPATCITLFKFENRSFHLHNIKEIEDEGNKNQRYNKLNESTYFFYNSTECRHVQILSYFGEGASNPCETTCDVCTNGPLRDHGIQSDKTELAKIVIHCVIEMQIVGKVNVTLLSQVLMGSVSAEILTSGLDKLNGYCKAKELLPGRSERKLLVKFIYYLILKGFLKETIRGASNCNVALTVGDVSNLLSRSVKIY
ncbi:ATP-dependent DNA helicase RecQ-like [Montipora capricornis]|uniref:ATP-dependent DNA helicase RecQ-like n=1 Tax=Montipora capricornis TaxID=246305 RepID=UPI0035F1FB30